MTWSIPNKGVLQHIHQSIPYSEYFDALTAGISGIDCVLSGCACTPQGSPDMTVAVAKGAVLTNGVLKPVTAGNVTIGTANGSNPRIDLIVVNSSGTKAVRAGTAAATPKPPARSANDVVLAAVYIPASDTTIASDQIADMKVERKQGPITVYNQSTIVTVNTSSSAIHLLNNGASGLTIPNGLFLTGKKLRVKMGGNLLLNSGTPTFAIEIIYGGTTLYKEVSAAATADTDRLAWNLEFDLNARSGSTQGLTGRVNLSDIANARNSPTTGVGSGFGAYSYPIQGTSSIDSDAADRVLAVTGTMSVSNAANEIVVETASVELV